MARFLLLACTLAIAACERAPLVEVNGETLQGMYVEDTGVAAFLGVPFAEPPVGELRWRAPQALSSRVAKRMVTEFAPACMQTMRILDWYRWLAEQLGGSGDYYADLQVSEDCLYLNIWTPTLAADAKLPVMIWVHGGSNKSGWSYEPNYHGHNLALQDVVVISIAYRQGVFGFLSHPELPRDEPVANFALWDMLAALNWVNEHAEKFGGDPGRVTMFGESAGAENILALMATNKVDGVLHRGVTQSTAGFGKDRMSTLADEEARAAGLAAALELPAADNLAALRAVPAEEILAAYTEAFPDYYHSPAIDEQLFEVPIWALIEGDALHGRELIIGSNDDEWYASTAEDTDWNDVADQAGKLFEKADPELVLAAVQDEPDPRRALDRLRTATSMLCSSQQVAARVNAAGGSAWMYHFTRAPVGINGLTQRAYHGAEYPYIFATRDPYFQESEIDAALQQAMQSYWVNFAKRGDPNGERLTDWPRFAPPDFPVQELGDEVFTKSAPEPELCALYAESN